MPLVVVAADGTRTAGPSDGDWLNCEAWCATTAASFSACGGVRSKPAGVAGPPPALPVSVLLRAATGRGRAAGPAAVGPATPTVGTPSSRSDRLEEGPVTPRTPRTPPAVAARTRVVRISPHEPAQEASHHTKALQLAVRGMLTRNEPLLTCYVTGWSYPATAFPLRLREAEAIALEADPSRMLPRLFKPIPTAISIGKQRYASAVSSYNDSARRVFANRRKVLQQQRRQSRALSPLPPPRHAAIDPPPPDEAGARRGWSPSKVDAVAEEVPQADEEEEDETDCNISDVGEPLGEPDDADDEELIDPFAPPPRRSAALALSDSGTEDGGDDSHRSGENPLQR
jgi:hypothetical protein